MRDALGLLDFAFCSAHLQPIVGGQFQEFQHADYFAVVGGDRQSGQQIRKMGTPFGNPPGVPVYSEWNANGAPASANSAAAAALPEDAFNRKVLGDPEVAARVQFMQPVSAENREAYLEMWQSLKAAQ